MRSTRSDLGPNLRGGDRNGYKQPIVQGTQSNDSNCIKVKGGTIGDGARSIDALGYHVDQFSSVGIMPWEILNSGLEFDTVQQRVITEAWENFQALNNGPWGNFQSSTDYLTLPQAQPFPNAQNRNAAVPGANTRPPGATQASLNDFAIHNISSALGDLRKWVGFIDEGSTFCKAIIGEIEETINTGLTRTSGKRPSTNGTTTLRSSGNAATKDTATAQLPTSLPRTNNTSSIGPLKSSHPSINDTNSIDLSRDPRPAAKARLAARHATDNADSEAPPNTADTHPRDRLASSGPRAPAAAHSAHPRSVTDSSQIRDAGKPSTVNPSLLHRRLPKDLDLPGDLPRAQSNSRRNRSSPANDLLLSRAFDPQASNEPRLLSRATGAPLSRDHTFSKENASVKDGSSSRLSHARTSGQDRLPASSGLMSASSHSHTSRLQDMSGTRRRQPGSSSATLLSGSSTNNHASANPRPPAGDSASRFSLGDDQSPRNSSAYTSTSRPVRQAPTDDNTRQIRRRSSSHQAETTTGNLPTDITRVSSRLNGPFDAIPGMAPGSGSDRLLRSQRRDLPKGIVGGESYCCEAKCGYPDWACETISCDSAYHRRKPQLTLPGGTKVHRCWYHKVCVGLPLDFYLEEGDTWICPRCTEKGRISTDDEDYDEGDDSEDDFQPRHYTPDEDGNDDDAGNDVEHDTKDTENKKRPNYKASNHDTSGQRRRLVSVQHDDDLDEGNVGDEIEYEEGYLLYTDKKKARSTKTSQNKNTGTLASHVSTAESQGQDDNISGNMEINHKEGYLVHPDTKLRVQIITNPGEPWIEDEKVLCVRLMKKIMAEVTFHGEDRFRETARCMKMKGYLREWIPVKNAWNRGLRERAGMDERRNKKAPMTTSKQDAETKRMNREKKERARMGLPDTATSSQQNASSKSSSPKREYDSDDEDEVLPAKRRRASPYEGDNFGSLR
jgi:hypothetical protein